MNIKEYALDLISKGFSDEQIAMKLKDHESAKALDAKGIIAILEEAKKEADLKAEFAKKEVEKKEEALKAKVAGEVKQIVDAELKKIKIEVEPKKSAKRYDWSKAKYVEQEPGTSESVEVFGKMLKALMSGKKAEAEAMSRDIDIENRKADNTTAAATGGYAVPTIVDTQIHQLIYANSVALQNFNTDVIMVNDKVYPTMANVTVGYIADEETAATQSTPAFSNPTVNMKRVGAFSAISNKLIGAANADVVQAFIKAYTAGFARFLDLHVFAGNVTFNSDLLDGLAFMSSSNLATPIALSALGVDDVATLVKTISDEASNLKLFGNRAAMYQLGLDETTGGMPYFPTFVNGGNIAPFGVPFILNPKIPSTLDVAGDKRTTGTSTALFLADCDKIMLGVGQQTRIDTSADFLFTKDQVVIRGIKDVGWTNLFGSGNTCQVLELTA